MNSARLLLGADNELRVMAIFSIHEFGYAKNERGIGGSGRDCGKVRQLTKKNGNGRLRFPVL
jgi:hypothetical protein